jgi:hypothetical protein
MPFIVISDEAEKAIRGDIKRDISMQGHQHPDGCWSIRLQQETLDELLNHQIPGETLSDTIIRLIRETHRSGKC